MNISYITTYNALDIHQWSGTGFHIAESLKDQGASIDYIGNLHFEHESLYKAKQLLYKLAGKRYIRNREHAVARSYARQVEKWLPAATDIIFAPDSIPLTYLNARQPKVFYTDATFAGMINYYDAYSNLCKETIVKANALEQQALSNCQMAIYASDWAAQTAIEYYDVSPGKVKVVPLGANIDCNRTLADIKQIVAHKPKDVCNLLLLGVDWVRKGGDLVVSIAQKLNDSGLKTHLHVAGIKDLDTSKLPPFVTSHGFLSKSTSSGRQKIDELMAQSHFLVVPSQAEAFGVVFCEASSFGLPSLATATGGITTVIQNNVNGHTFALGAKADEYATYILNQMSNPAGYGALALSSYNDYCNRLSWEASGKSVIQLLKQL